MHQPMGPIQQQVMQNRPAAWGPPHPAMPAQPMQPAYQQGGRIQQAVHNASPQWAAPRPATLGTQVQPMYSQAAPHGPARGSPPRYGAPPPATRPPQTSSFPPIQLTAMPGPRTNPGVLWQTMPRPSNPLSNGVLPLARPSDWMGPQHTEARRTPSLDQGILRQSFREGSAHAVSNNLSDGVTPLPSPTDWQPPAFGTTARAQEQKVDQGILRQTFASGSAHRVSNNLSDGVMPFASPTDWQPPGPMRRHTV